MFRNYLKQHEKTIHIGAWEYEGIKALAELHNISPDKYTSRYLKQCYALNFCLSLLRHFVKRMPKDDIRRIYADSLEVFLSETDKHREDIDISKRLCDCGELMDVKLIDSVIIAGVTGEYASMKAIGIL